MKAILDFSEIPSLAEYGEIVINAEHLPGEGYIDVQPLLKDHITYSEAIPGLQKDISDKGFIMVKTITHGFNDLPGIGMTLVPSLKLGHSEIGKIKG